MDITPGKPTIITISGPSCAGKSTVLSGLERALPNLRPLESVTTREPRPSDNPGEYLYVSQQEFEDLEASGEFLWTVRPYGSSWYGTRKSAVDLALVSREVFAPILVLSAVEALHEYARVQGKQDYVRSVYLMIKDEAELHRRFRERQDTDQKDIEERIKRLETENAHAILLNAPIVCIDATQPREKVLADVLAAITN